MIFILTLKNFKIIVSHAHWFFFSSLSDDADKLRIHTLSEAGDMDSLEKMVDGSDSEDSSGESSSAPWFTYAIFHLVFSAESF